MTKAYGWVRDVHDPRDFIYAAKPAVRPLPKVDLRPKFPPIYDQAALGSCVGNAVGADHAFKQNLDHRFIPSRLFIYYNARVLEHTTATDSGCSIRDGIKVVVKQGVPPESVWPYDVTKFAERPSVAAYTNALKSQVLRYERIVGNDISAMKVSLSQTVPFVFGFQVYENFESAEVARTGILPMPQGNPVGSHAVVGVGYDTAKGVFIIRNSWGTKWGMKGYFTMPEAYLKNSGLAGDFWVIQEVEAPLAA